MPTKGKIVFRADAGANIGYGHFIRTLALADMLKDDFECVFYTQSPTEYQAREASAVCPLVGLPSDSSKFELFLDILNGDEIVVLDNYFFDTKYQQTIKDKGCRLVCIDDMHEKHYVADVVINHAITNATLFDVEPYTRLCLGLEWALVRAPFLEADITRERHKGHCVVAFGGVDKYNLTAHVCKELCHRADILRITAIVGDAYADDDMLRQTEKVRIEKNLSAEEVAALFCESEFAVLSASTICVEAILCGCRVAAGYYVNNQVEYMESLAEKHYIFPLGCLTDQGLGRKLRECNFSDTAPPIPSNIASRYKELFTALSLRVVDYTEMTAEEHQILWQIRNLPEIRRYMGNPNAFDYESHQNFVKGLRDCQTKKYWGIFDGEKLIGGYNVVDIMDGIAERGLFINPSLWGVKSYAQVMESVIDEKLKRMGIYCVKAKVLKDNIRSVRYHQKAGYLLVGEDSEYVYFSRNLK